MAKYVLWRAFGLGTISIVQMQPGLYCTDVSYRFRWFEIEISLYFIFFFYFLDSVCIYF